MKYSEDLTAQLCKMLSDGYGRVAAVKAVGIHYQTFLDWMRDERKPEFSEAIKKAEYCGKDFIKDVCKRRIIEDENWQSAAWWLERNYPEEFGKRQAIEHSGKVDNGGIIIKTASKEDIAEVKKLINGN